MNKIMIVDDDPAQIFTAEEILKEAEGNYKVISANSGMDCLQLLKNNEIPDLILLDIMMPGISGWETFQRIKQNERWSKIPIVFLTARTDVVAEKAGRFLGEDYIEKPINSGDLVRRIDLVLKNSSQK
ncbi:MAG: response regulator [Thermoplasmatales archaeon]|nr:response regulator [Thermoplasmatales archaeon]